MRFLQNKVVSSKYILDLVQTSNGTGTDWVIGTDDAAITSAKVLVSRASLTASLISSDPTQSEAAAHVELNSAGLVILGIRTGGVTTNLADATDLFPSPQMLGLSPGTILRIVKVPNDTTKTGQIPNDNIIVEVTGGVGHFILSGGSTATIPLMYNVEESRDILIGRKKELVDGDTSEDFVYLV